MSDYPLYLTLVITATASPGPAVFLAVKNGARYGILPALIGTLGNVTGLALITTLSALGIGAVIVASELLFGALKLLGGAYLVYLGVKLWRTSGEAALPQTPASSVHSSKQLYKEALTVALSNPKGIAFCTAIFPQFLDPTAPFVAQFVPLALTLWAGSFGCLGLYALLASRMQGFLERPAVLRRFSQISGAIFIGLGVLLALY